MDKTKTLWEHVGTNPLLNVFAESVIKNKCGDWTIEEFVALIDMDLAGMVEPNVLKCITTWLEKECEFFPDELTGMTKMKGKRLPKFLEITYDEMKAQLKAIGVFEKHEVRFMRDGGGHDKSRLAFRRHQQECLEKVKKRFEESNEEKMDTFLCVMPTGAGKTMTLQYIPFVCNAKKVLIVTPNVTIRNQLRKEFDGGAVYGLEKRLQMLQAREDPGVKVVEQLGISGDAFLYHIQKLVKKRSPKKRKRPHDHGDPGLSLNIDEQSVTVTENLAAIDLIIFDEGHHLPAETFKSVCDNVLRIQREHQSKNKDFPKRKLKVVLMTATPCRGDGKKFDCIDDEEQIYVYTRESAVKDSIIRRTEYVPVTIAEPRRIDRTPTSDAYMEKMFSEACEELRKLRMETMPEGATRGGGKSSSYPYPFRMLVLVNSIKEAQAAAKFFNENAEEKKWLVPGLGLNREGKSRCLYATYIASSYPTDEKGNSSRLNTEETKKRSRKFIRRLEMVDGYYDGAYFDNRRDDLPIDVGIQCNTLGEGYDNAKIIVSLALRCPRAGNVKLPQFHGRALRKLKLNDEQSSKYSIARDRKERHVLHAALVYPTTDSMEKQIQEYKDGEDEKKESILLGQTNVTFRKLTLSATKATSGRCYESLFGNRTWAEIYHEQLEEIRKEWTPQPYERVVEEIIKDCGLPLVKDRNSGTSPSLLTRRSRERRIIIADMGSGPYHKLAKFLDKQMTNYVRGSVCFEVIEVDTKAVLDISKSDAFKDTEFVQVHQVACNILDEVMVEKTMSNWKHICDFVVYNQSIVSKQHWWHVFPVAIKLLKRDSNGYLFITDQGHRFGITNRNVRDTHTRSAILQRLEIMLNEMDFCDCKCDVVAEKFVRFKARLPSQAPCEGANDGASKDKEGQISRHIEDLVEQVFKETVAMSQTKRRRKLEPAFASGKKLADESPRRDIATKSSSADGFALSLFDTDSD